MSRSFRLVETEHIANDLLNYLRANGDGGIQQLNIAGSYRRRKEFIRNLNVLVACVNGKSVMEHVQAYKRVRRMEHAGMTYSAMVLDSGITVDLHIVPLHSYGVALQYFTGSREHNLNLQALAGEQGVLINKQGIFQDGSRVGGQKEEDVYSAAGVAWIPPELREQQGELEAAARQRMPALINLHDIRGNLHMHSTWPDGKDSLERMAYACRDLGYAYCAITDHSRSTRAAGGLAIEELPRQWDEIHKLRTRLPGLHLLAGAEVDILDDGSLDYPDPILEQLDVVVASVHVNLRMTRAQMTKRLVNALSHPLVDILGHPTGRQFNVQEPVDVDLEEVMHAAKQYNVALELNAQPKRLDLHARYVRQAKEAGVKVVINSDAHSTENLQYMRYGIDQARRGWLEPGDVINTMDWPGLQQWLQRT